MGAFDTILYPIKWVVAWILHLFHELWTLVGLDPTSGWSWALSIVGLTVGARADRGAPAAGHPAAADRAAGPDGAA